MRTRERNIECLDYPVATKNYMGTVSAVSTTAFRTAYPYLRCEETVDEIHSNYPYEGGPFSSRKATFEHTFGHGKSGTEYTTTTGTRYVNTRTGEIAVKPSSGFSVPPGSTVPDAEAHGAEAWNRFKPAKPQVSGSVFIAELRDIPGLVLKRLNSFRSLGNNYLAVQFGWKPFLSDLRKWYTSLMKIDAQIAQLRRDNGNYIKRGGTLFREEDTDTWRGDSASLFYTPLSIDSASVTRITNTSEHCWFSARFRYYIPGLNDPRWGRLRAIQELWDLKITPEQIYELVPFSWLLDWFSNTGDVISNLMSQVEDNLTAKYAYVMYERDTTETTVGIARHKVMTGTYPLLTPTYNTSTSKCVRRTNSKARVAASPFGFNVSFDGLTGYQTSILTALGLSRLRF